MHDPMTVAFEIKAPWKRKYLDGSKSYRPTLVTVWHVDPEKDGSDDSCGWFPRARHMNQDVLNRIVSRFDFDWDAHDYGRWFNKDGTPYLSTIGITLCMFHIAAFEHFNKNRRKSDRFIAKHLADILHFAENPTDSMHDGIVGKYGFEERARRIRQMAGCVYGCVFRWSRPWWKHARWHVHHWKIQIPFIQDLKRWLFSRCEHCGKRFQFGEAPCTASWNGTGPLWFRGEKHVHHSECFGKSDVFVKNTATPRQAS